MRNVVRDMQALRLGGQAPAAPAAPDAPDAQQATASRYGLLSLLEALLHAPGMHLSDANADAEAEALSQALRALSPRAQEPNVAQVRLYAGALAGVTGMLERGVALYTDGGEMREREPAGADSIHAAFFWLMEAVWWLQRENPRLAAQNMITAATSACRVRTRAWSAAVSHLLMDDVIEYNPETAEDAVAHVRHALTLSRRALPLLWRHRVRGMSAAAAADLCAEITAIFDADTRCETEGDMMGMLVGAREDEPDAVSAGGMIHSVTCVRGMPVCDCVSVYGARYAGVIGHNDRELAPLGLQPFALYTHCADDPAPRVTICTAHGGRAPPVAMARYMAHVRRALGLWGGHMLPVMVCGLDELV